MRISDWSSDVCSSDLKDLLDGAPRVVVRDGEIVRENLRRDRLTRDEILSEMRLAGIGRMSDVAWAILEPQGKMSFIRKADGDARQQDRDAPAHCSAYLSQIAMVPRVPQSKIGRAHV